MAEGYQTPMGRRLRGFVAQQGARGVARSARAGQLCSIHAIASGGTARGAATRLGTAPQERVRSNVLSGISQPTGWGRRC